MESLIVVRTGHGSIRAAEIDTADLRTEQARTGVSHHRKGAKAMHIYESRPHQSPIDLGFPELDREIEWCIQNSVEIVCSTRELPEVFRLNAEFRAELLFNTDIELIASSRRKWLNLGSIH